MLETLGEFWIVEVENIGIVHLWRTAEPYSDIASVVDSFEILLAKFREIGAAEKGLFVDFRRGPPARNDSEFEKAAKPYRTKLFEGFAVGAVLVKTAAGLMQLTRTAREDGRVYEVFDDEEELRSYLDSHLNNRVF